MSNSWLSALLPAAVSAIAPGIGGALGGALTDAVGLSSTLGTTGSNVLGNALVGGGLGALTGGSRGALTGALVGGATPLAMSALGGFGGGALGSLFGGQGVDPSTLDAKDLVGAKYGSGAAGASNAGGQSSSLFSSLLGGGGSGGSSLAKLAPLALIGAAVAGGAGKKPKGAAVPQVATDQNMGNHLSQVSFTPRQNPYTFDAFKYGFQPQHKFFENNNLGAVQAAARGGMMHAQPGQMDPYMSDPYAQGGPSRGVQGPGTGREDKIPALLSDGEYVIDAETVALLGDGSSKAGSQKLDEFRQNIRRQKGAALARGQISPDARAPERYLMGAR